MTQRLVRPLAVAIVLFAAGAVLSAHLAMTKSLPAKDATVQSPTRIQVWFTQEPSLALSALSVEGASGKATLGAIAAGEENSLVADVSGTLAPGAYTITWQTAGHDGHVLKGSIPFTVAATR
ncbi:MAG: copper resistance protein CopC [Vicinamibacterales bacterium]